VRQPFCRQAKPARPCITFDARDDRGMSSRALPPCLVLAACIGSSDQSQMLNRVIAQAPRSRVELDGNRVVSTAVPIDRRALPRNASVAIDAVQPGGEVLALEQVVRGNRLLYRASTRYRAPADDLRTVLVDRDGTIVERSHEIAPARAATDLGLALATMQDALQQVPERIEIVHGEGGGEWVRAHASGRVVDCELSGSLRSAHTFEWRYREDAAAQPSPGR
jgi:hypothetical protein